MFTRDAFESILENAGFVEFSNAEQLLDVLRQGQIPSLILMDINMPRISGLEALSIIRSWPETRQIPVILFSNSSSPDTIKQAYQLGVNAYIVKPFSVDGYARMAMAAKLCFLSEEFGPEKIINVSPAKHRSILVIEDNPDHWAIMKPTLETQHGVNLIHTGNAADTMAFLHNQYRTFQPAMDLIILDLYLPGRQQGLELIESIRNFFID